MTQISDEDLIKLGSIDNILGIKWLGGGCFQIGEDEGNGQSMLLLTGFGGVRDYIKAFEDHARESIMQSSSDQESS